MIYKIKFLNFTIMYVDIGKKIKDVLYESRISVQDFSKKINKSRSAAYAILDRDTIDTGLLEQISKALDHDFFQYYVNRKSMVKESRLTYGIDQKEVLSLKKETQKYSRELNELKEKYVILEKYSKLLEEKIKAKKKKK